jgi:uncharacterized protein
MRDSFPDEFDPLAFAEKARHLRGELELSRLDRLANVLADKEGKVSFDLQFSKEGRIPCIRGHVEAWLVLQCQCCLEPLPWLVRSDVNLGVAGTVDESLRLPESLEPLLLETGATVSLADIVQDELLLGIPVIPQHPDCRLPSPADAAPERPHPFAGLAHLKTH